MSSAFAPTDLTSPATPPDELVGLRILAFCDYFTPNATGGSERVAMEVYRRLADWGATVTVLGGVPSQGDEFERPPYRVLARPAKDLSRYVGVQLALSRGLVRDGMKALRDVGADVLTGQSIHFQSTLAAALLTCRSALPLVTTVHVAGIDNLPWRVRLPSELYERTVGRLVLARSDRVIAVSRPVSQHLLSLGVPDQKLRVVPNGVDHAVYHAREGRSRGTHDSIPTVAFVGRFIANKGASEVVAALGQLHGEGVAFRATLLGDGPLRDALRSRVMALGLSSLVTFPGAVTDVSERLRAADVFVRPSTTEGMSLALLEAMACEVCVVVSDIPANASLVTHGQSGFLSRPGDYQRLVDNLRIALTDPVRRRRLAATGREVALSYSWDRCAAETARVLLEVARP